MSEFPNPAEIIAQIEEDKKTGQASGQQRGSDDHKGVDPTGGQEMNKQSAGSDGGDGGGGNGGGDNRDPKSNANDETSNQTKSSSSSGHMPVGKEIPSRIVVPERFRLRDRSAWQKKLKSAGLSPADKAQCTLWFAVGQRCSRVQYRDLLGTFYSRAYRFDVEFATLSPVLEVLFGAKLTDGAKRGPVKALGRNPYGCDYLDLFKSFYTIERHSLHVYSSDFSDMARLLTTFPSPGELSAFLYAKRVTNPDSKEVEVKLTQSVASGRVSAVRELAGQLGSDFCQFAIDSTSITRDDAVKYLEAHPDFDPLKCGKVTQNDTGVKNVAPSTHSAGGQSGFQPPIKSYAAERRGQPTQGGVMSRTDPFLESQADRFTNNSMGDSVTEPLLGAGGGGRTEGNDAADSLWNQIEDALLNDEEDDGSAAMSAFAESMGGGSGSGGGGAGTRAYEKAMGAYVGLKNQGATCYMNSLLQSLYMTPAFRRALFQWRYCSKRDKEHRLEMLPFQIQMLLGRMVYNQQFTQERALSTWSLTQAFGWDNDSGFSSSKKVFDQHDIQELMRVFFDALESYLDPPSKKSCVTDILEGRFEEYVFCTRCKTRSANRPIFHDVTVPVLTAWEAGAAKRERLRKRRAAKKAKKAKKKKEKAKSDTQDAENAGGESAAKNADAQSVGVGDGAGGDGGDTGTKNGANTKSGGDVDGKSNDAGSAASSEKAQADSAPPNNSAKGHAPSEETAKKPEETAKKPEAPEIKTRKFRLLEESIHQFLSPDTLGGLNAYRCSKCKKRVTAFKGTDIVAMPPVLTLSLKRFTYNYSTRRREKINKMLCFPFFLDITPFVGNHRLPIPEEMKDELDIGEIDTSAVCAAACNADLNQHGILRLARSCVQDGALCEEWKAQSVTDDGKGDKKDGEGAASGDVSSNDTQPAEGEAATAQDSNKPCEGSESKSHGSPKKSDAKPDEPPLDAVPAPSHPVVYELYSVVVHTGSGAAGHYYAFIKDLSYHDQILQYVKTGSLPTPDDPVKVTVVEEGDKIAVDKPNSDAGVGAEQPGDSTDKPGDSTDKPGDSTDKPGDSEKSEAGASTDSAVDATSKNGSSDAKSSSGAESEATDKTSSGATVDLTKDELGQYFETVHSWNQDLLRLDAQRMQRAEGSDSHDATATSKDAGDATSTTDPDKTATNPSDEKDTQDSGVSSGGGGDTDGKDGTKEGDESKAAQKKTQWYRFDDSSVYPVAPSDVQAAYGDINGKSSASAYVLFYRRLTPPPLPKTPTLAQFDALPQNAREAILKDPQGPEGTFGDKFDRDRILREHKRKFGGSSGAGTAFGSGGTNYGTSAPMAVPKKEVLCYAAPSVDLEPGMAEVRGALCQLFSTAPEGKQDGQVGSEEASQASAAKGASGTVKLSPDYISPFQPLKSQTPLSCFVDEKGSMDDIFREAHKLYVRRLEGVYGKGNVALTRCRLRKFSEYHAERQEILHTGVYDPEEFDVNGKKIKKSKKKKKSKDKDKDKDKGKEAPLDGEGAGADKGPKGGGGTDHADGTNGANDKPPASAADNNDTPSDPAPDHHKKPSVVDGSEQWGSDFWAKQGGDIGGTTTTSDPTPSSTQSTTAKTDTAPTSTSASPAKDGATTGPQQSKPVVPADQRGCSISQVWRLQFSFDKPKVCLEFLRPGEAAHLPYNHDSLKVALRVMCLPGDAPREPSDAKDGGEKAVKPTRVAPYVHEPSKPVDLVVDSKYNVLQLIEAACIRLDVPLYYLDQEEQARLKAEKEREKRLPFSSSIYSWTDNYNTVLPEAHYLRWKMSLVKYNYTTSRNEFGTFSNLRDRMVLADVHKGTKLYMEELPYGYWLDKVDETMKPELRKTFLESYRARDALINLPKGIGELISRWYEMKTSFVHVTFNKLPLPLWQSNQCLEHLQEGFRKDYMVLPHRVVKASSSKSDEVLTELEERFPCAHSIHYPFDLDDSQQLQIARGYTLAQLKDRIAHDIMLPPQSFVVCPAPRTRINKGFTCDTTPYVDMNATISDILKMESTNKLSAGTTGRAASLAENVVTLRCAVVLGTQTVVLPPAGMGKQGAKGSRAGSRKPRAGAAGHDAVGDIAQRTGRRVLLQEVVPNGPSAGMMMSPRCAVLVDPDATLYDLCVAASRRIRKMRNFMLKCASVGATSNRNDAESKSSSAPRASDDKSGGDKPAGDKPARDTSADKAKSRKPRDKPSSQRPGARRSGSRSPSRRARGNRDKPDKTSRTRQPKVVQKVGGALIPSDLDPIYHPNLIRLRHVSVRDVKAPLGLPWTEQRDEFQDPDGYSDADTEQNDGQSLRRRGVPSRSKGKKPVTRDMYKTVRVRDVVFSEGRFYPLPELAFDLLPAPALHRFYTAKLMRDHGLVSPHAALLPSPCRAPSPPDSLLRTALTQDQVCLFFRVYHPSIYEFGLGFQLTLSVHTPLSAAVDQVWNVLAGYYHAGGCVGEKKACGDAKTSGEEKSTGGEKSTGEEKSTGDKEQGDGTAQPTDSDSGSKHADSREGGDSDQSGNSGSNSKVNDGGKAHEPNTDDKSSGDGAKAKAEKSQPGSSEGVKTASLDDDAPKPSSGADGDDKPTSPTTCQRTGLRINNPKRVVRPPSGSSDRVPFAEAKHILMTKSAFKPGRTAMLEQDWFLPQAEVYRTHLLSSEPLNLGEKSHGTVLYIRDSRERTPQPPKHVAEMLRKMDQGENLYSSYNLGSQSSSSSFNDYWPLSGGTSSGGNSDSRGITIKKRS